MTVAADADGEAPERPCANHPSVMTLVSCGKCAKPICPRCMVFTQVGVRCKDCGRVRKAIRAQIPLPRLALASIGGLVVATLGWLFVLETFLVMWFVALILGFAAGEVASRLARGRNNIWLEIAVGADLVIGFIIASEIVGLSGYLFLSRFNTFATVTFVGANFALIPLVCAVVAAIVRLRR